MRRTLHLTGGNTEPNHIPTTTLDTTISEFKRALNNTFNFPIDTENLHKACLLAAHLKDLSLGEAKLLRYVRAEELAQYGGLSPAEIKSELAFTDEKQLAKFLLRHRSKVKDALGWDMKEFNNALKLLPLIHEDTVNFFISLDKEMRCEKKPSTVDVFDKSYPLRGISKAATLVIKAFTGVPDRAPLRDISFQSTNSGMLLLFKAKINYEKSHEFIIATNEGEVFGEFPRGRITGNSIYDTLTMARPIEIGDLNIPRKIINDHKSSKYLFLHEGSGGDIFLPSECPNKLFPVITPCTFLKNSNYRIVYFCAPDPKNSNKPNLEDKVMALVYSKDSKKIEVVFANNYSFNSDSKRLFSLQIVAFLNGEKNLVPNFYVELKSTEVNKKRVWIGGYYFDIDGLTTNSRVIAGIVYNKSQNRYALGFWINPLSNKAKRSEIDSDIRFYNEPDLIYSYSNKRFSRETKSQRDWSFAPCSIPFN